MPLPGSPRNRQFLQEIKEPTHEEKPITKMTKAELVVKAKEMGIKVQSGWKKQELLMEILGQ